MAEGIATALIALGGVILTQLISYLISRQSARDLRVSIDREIEIIRKLRPDSDEVRQLEAHVSANIAKLIARDDRREMLFSALATAAPLPVLGLIGWGLQAWYSHGMPEPLRGVAVVLFWIVNVLFAGLVGLYAGRTVNLGIAIVRLWWMASRANWRHLRRLRANEKRLKNARKNNRAVHELIETIEKHPLGKRRHRDLQKVKQHAAENANSYDEIEAEIAEMRDEIRDYKPVRSFLKEYRNYVRRGRPD